MLSILKVLVGFQTQENRFPELFVAISRRAAFTSTTSLNKKLIYWWARSTVALDTLKQFSVTQRYRGGEYSKFLFVSWRFSCAERSVSTGKVVPWMILTHASVAFLLFRWSTVKKHLDKAWLKGATRKDVHQGKFPADIIKIGPKYVPVTTANLPEQKRCRKIFKPLKYQFIFYSLLKV